MIKGLFAAVVVVFAGFVGYKILKKKNPELIKKVKGSISEAGKNIADNIAAAKESFYEGYSRA